MGNKSIMVTLIITLIVVAGLAINNINQYSYIESNRHADNEQFKHHLFMIRTYLNESVNALDNNNTFFAIYDLNRVLDRLYLIDNLAWISNDYSTFLGATQADRMTLYEKLGFIINAIYCNNITSNQITFLRQCHVIFNDFILSLPMGINSNYTISNIQTNIQNFHDLAQDARDLELYGWQCYTCT